MMPHFPPSPEVRTTFPVPYRDFKRIAELALRCVGTDPLLPVFTFVEFRASGGVLLATATDRPCSPP